MSKDLKLQTANLYLNISDEWLEKLDNLAVEKEQNIEQLVLDIIGNYLSDSELNLENNQRLEEYQNLNQRLEVLEKKRLSNRKINNQIRNFRKVGGYLTNKRD